MFQILGALPRVLALNLPPGFKKFLMKISEFFLFDITFVASGIGCVTYGMYDRTLLLNLFLVIGILATIAVVYVVETVRARRSIEDENSEHHDILLRELYSKFDPDGDGIGLDELRHIVGKIDSNTPGSTVEAMFEAADVDKGGKISFDEFANAVTGAGATGNSSLTEGLATVVMKAEIMKLQADAIGRFFLIIFLCCKYDGCKLCLLLPTNSTDTCMCRSPAHQQDLRGVPLPRNRPGREPSDR